MSNQKEQLLKDLGFESNYNDRYPGWALDMAQRLLDEGWVKPDAT